MSKFKPTWPIRNLTEDQKKKVRKWVKALESEQYRQGEGRLCLDGGMCCLGVLCVINDLPNSDFDGLLEFYGSSASIRKENPVYDITESYGALPNYIRLPNLSGAKNLADLNDNGATFPQIAQIIRRYYLGENVPLPEGFEEVGK